VQKGETQLIVVTEEADPGGARFGGRALLEGEMDWLGGVLGEGEEEAAIEQVIEECVYLVAILAKVGGEIEGGEVCLGEQAGIGVPFGDPAANRFEDRMGIRGPSLQIFAEERGSIEAKAIDAEVEPVADDAADFFLDIGVLLIQVGFEAVEVVEVPLLANRDVLPDGLLEAGEDRFERGHVVEVISPDVVIAIGGILVLEGGAEPGVLIRGVVDREIHKDADIALLCLTGEATEVIEGSEPGVDTEVVGDIVAVVLAGRRIERKQPDGVDAEIDQVVHGVDDALEVTDPVAVAIAEGGDIDDVENCLVEPFGEVRLA
jgi:hypothetical protein